MLTPELFLAFGIILIAGSAIAFYIAQYVRAWFFQPDPKVELIPVRAEREYSTRR